MEKNVLLSAVPTESKFIWDGLGITTKRAHEILDVVDNLLKVEPERHKVIIDCWNTFEEPNEKAFALYAINTEERKLHTDPIRAMFEQLVSAGSAEEEED